MELRRWSVSKNTKQVSPNLWRELKCKTGCPLGEDLKEEATDVTRKGKDRNPYLSLCPLFSNFCTIAQDQPNPSGTLTVREATHHQPLRSASRGVTAGRLLAQMFSTLYYPIGMYMLCGNFPSLQSAPALAPSSFLQQHWSPLSPCGDLLCQSFPSPELWGGSNYA